MRNRVSMLCAFTVLVSFAAPLRAEQEIEQNTTIKQIAVNSGNASVNVNNPGPSKACGLSLIQFNPTTTAGRVILATLLDARARNGMVDIIYDRNVGTCILVQVHSR